MQLMIDIAVEKPAALRLCAQFLTDHAQLREAEESGKPAARVAPPALSTPSVLPEPADFHDADLQRAQQDMNNNGPLVPPAPLAPTATVPATSTASPPSAPVPAGTLVPVAPPAIPLVTAVVAPAPPTASTTAAPTVITAAPDEFDSSGVPFDARIHQKTKGIKKDGTWKLQKNIADDLVASVMQELAPRIRKPAAPVVPTVPAVPSPGAFDPSLVPPAPTAHYINGVLQPPAMGASAPVVPPAPAAAPTAQPALDPFRALVRKITEAKAAGRISVEEVSQCVANAGVPSLQLLNNMPHLIGTVEGNIDMVLALR